MGSIFSLLLTAAPYIAINKQLLIPLLKDPFAVDCLSTEVHWSGMEPLIGIVYFLVLIASVWVMKKRSLVNGSLTLFVATALCLLIYLKIVVPKIERYSQGPAIDFYESLQGQNVYVTTKGFKSYAPYFYFRKPQGYDPQSSSAEWLLQTVLDRPAYFVVKTTSMKEMEQYADVKFLRKEGGFAFYVRQPVK
jgi:hypothetical protein